MASTIKVRTAIKDDITTVRTIIKHPMHTGFGSDEETGQHIPPHYIKRVNVHHGEKLVLQCYWSRAISRNPYLSFMFKGAKAGDSLRISWEDNKGLSDSIKVTIN
jgi:sulfur-oxidizing protein SoxZ